MRRKTKKILSLALASILSCIVAIACQSQAPEQPSANTAPANPAPEKQEKVDWSYKGEDGPNRWGELSPEFATCKIGGDQSPIDINTKTVTKGDAAKKIEFSYQPTALNVKNTGYGIQVDYGSGSKAKIDSQEYQLLQFHFHAPSEHTIDGKAYPLEFHLVHQNQATKKLAVVGVFVKEGKKNEALELISSNMPKTEGVKEVSGTAIDASNLLPADSFYYNYPGSLTTPPCSEEVNWNVMTGTIEASKEQIEAFKTLFNTNARPVQPLGDRKIKLKG